MAGGVEAGRYLQGLKRLNAGDRRLLVGRAELGCSHRQLVFTERLLSPEAARKGGGAGAGASDVLRGMPGSRSSRR